MWNFSAIIHLSLNHILIELESFIAVKISSAAYSLQSGNWRYSAKHLDSKQFFQGPPFNGECGCVKNVETV